jgi:hypothetical protein
MLEARAGAPLGFRNRFTQAPELEPLSLTARECRIENQPGLGGEA